MLLAMGYLHLHKVHAQLSIKFSLQLRGQTAHPCNLILVFTSHMCLLWSIDVHTSQSRPWSFWSCAGWYVFALVANDNWQSWSIMPWCFASKNVIYLHVRTKSFFPLHIIMLNWLFIYFTELITILISWIDYLFTWLNWLIFFYLFYLLFICKQ